MIVAALSCIAMGASWAGPYAPQEFDFSGLEEHAHGTVESVREVPLASERPELAEAFEHALRPQTGDQLLILLDDGRALRVMESETQRLEAGQRVRIRVRHVGYPRRTRVSAFRM